MRKSFTGTIFSLSLPPESFDSDNVLFIFYAVLVDEGRDDPDTTKADRNRPASKTRFDGLGSSREH